MHALRFTLLTFFMLLFPGTAIAEPLPPLVCDRVTFPAAPEMIGSKIEGSNTSRIDGFTTLATIRDASGEVKFDNKTVYRWLRLIGPRGREGKLGKVEFYAGDRLIAGEKKGVSYHLFVNDVQDDQSVGYDLVDAAALRVTIKPDKMESDGPMDVTLSSTKGATIRFTTDGSWPTAQSTLYEKPIHIEKTTTLCAEAFLPERAPSVLNTATYLIKGSSKPGLSTAHIGNSLTGTTSGFYRYVRTAGIDHKALYFRRGGALTRELWALASGTYVNDKKASLKEKDVRAKGSEGWDDYWAKIDKVDMLTLQPRDFDLDKEVAAELSFIQRFREKSPELQPWLYCEWVEQKRGRPSDRGEVPSYQMQKTFPALTWEESMGAMLLYVEELQHRLQPQLRGGKPARIIPSALAMGWMKNKIDRGQFGSAKPGDFYTLLFHDQVHPADTVIHGTQNGAYLVNMTWFSAFYQEPPEGKVLPIETSFTPEQARIVERLAWDVIKNYPDCGLYGDGREPCGKPEFANDGKIITLSSKTPGAWFRYTLDGTEPTRTRGYVYCGKISVQPGIRVKAVAYKSGMADSETSAP